MQRRLSDRRSTKGASLSYKREHVEAGAREEQLAVILVLRSVNRSRSRSRHGRRLPARCWNAGVLGLAVTTGSVASCERYEPPCHAGANGIVLEGIGSSPSVALNADGSAIVTWFRYGDDGTAAPSGSRSARTPTGLEIAVLEGDGAIADRRSVDAPSSLVKRKGNTDGIGAVWTGQGVIFHWIEKSTQTAPDGSSTTSSDVAVQFVAVGGREGALRTPAGGSCVDCAFRVSAAPSAAGMVSLLYAKVPTANLGAHAAAPERPDANFLTLGADGTVAAAGNVPWVAATITPTPPSGGGLGIPESSAGSSPPRVENVAGALIVRTERGAWAVDPRFAQVAGPVADLQDALLLWDVERDAVATISARTLLAMVDGGSTNGVGEEPDLIFRRFDNSGSPRSRPERVSTGAQLKSFARSAERYGVVFASGQNRYFALLDRNGNKIGGDIEIDSAVPPSVTPGLALGGFGASSGFDALSAGASGGFVRLSSDGQRVHRREIICAR